MRIIITTQGENTQKEIEEVVIPTLKRNNTCEYNKMIYKKFTVDSNRKKYNKGKSSVSFIKKDESNENFDKNDNIFYKGRNSERQTKKVHLKLAKISFPKRIVDNYENDIAHTENIIEDISNSPELMKLKQNNINGKKYTLGEILGRKTVYELKKKLIEEEKMKDKLTKINENNFRSSFENFTKLEKLDQVLNYKKIQPGNTNLIRYINQNKNDIDKCSLNKIIKFDNLQMFKANKICQNVFVNQKQRKVLKDHLSHKIRMKHNQDKIGFVLDLKEMKRGIDIGKKIFNTYDKKKVDKMEKYIDAYNDTQSLFWKKFNCEHLERRTNRNKMLLTNIDY